VEVKAIMSPYVLLIATAVERRFPLDSKATALLDFGCGTGLLAESIADKVAFIMGISSSISSTITTSHPLLTLFSPSSHPLFTLFSPFLARSFLPRSFVPLVLIQHPLLHLKLLSSSSLPPLSDDRSVTMLLGVDATAEMIAMFQHKIDTKDSLKGKAVLLSPPFSPPTLSFTLSSLGFQPLLSLL